MTIVGIRTFFTDITIERPFSVLPPTVDADNVGTHTNIPLGCVVAQEFAEDEPDLRLGFPVFFYSLCPRVPLADRA